MQNSKDSKFTLALDSSQVYTYLTCPLKWWYQYNENLALDTKQAVAPDKGTLIHKLLDMYYTLRWQNPGDNKLTQANDVIDYFNKENITKELFPADNGDLNSFICNRFYLYVQRHINDDFILPQSRTNPIEVGFSKKLYEDKNVLFLVEGRLDLGQILIQGEIPCWVDHKTQDRDTTLYKYKPQFKTYAWATGYKYGLVNYIGMQEDKNNEILKKGRLFKQDLISFNQTMIDEWEQKMILIFWEITDILRLYDPDKEKHFYFIRNEASCSGPFDSNPCFCTTICEETNWEMKQKIKQMKYLKHEPWSPWKINEPTI